jgi:peptide deformylase
MKILEYPHPVLETVCTAIEPGENISKILSALKQQHRRAKGAGLAAPQLGFSRRIFIASIVRQGNLRNQFFINPVYLPLRDKDGTTAVSEGAEGCLSIPGKRFLVPRYEGIRITAEDEKRIPFTLDLWWDGARVVQHELDHLNGKLISRFRELPTLEVGKSDIGARGMLQMVAAVASFV